MAQVERKWIADHAVNNEKIDPTDTYTITGLRVDETSAIGRIGIGEMNPLDPLHITRTDTSAGLMLDLNDGTSGRSYQIYSGQSGVLNIKDVDTDIDRFSVYSTTTVGRVGISMTLPQDTVHARSTLNSSALRLDLDDGLLGRAYRLVSDSDGTFKIIDVDAGPALRLQISDSGTLTCPGDATFDSNFQINGTVTVINTEIVLADKLEINQTDATDAALIVSQDNVAATATVMRIENAGTGYALTIDSGYVGIGTTNPLALLHVQGDIFTADGSNIGDNTHRIGTLYMASAINHLTNLDFNSNGPTQVTFATNGRVGIGSATPTDALDVVGNIANTGNIITSGTYPSGLVEASNLIITTGPSIFNGNVGIGTTPAYPLHVNGHIVSASGNLTLVTGNIIATVGSIAAGTTVTGGTGVVATTGNIVATAGSITANSSITAVLGNIVATTGNITATAGSVSAGASMAATTTISAGQGITSSSGNITALSGDLVTLNGTVVGKQLTISIGPNTLNGTLSVGGTISWTGGSSGNANTAYSERRQWDGGATNLVAATGRTSLGLGTMATQNSNSVSITGGSITGVTFPADLRWDGGSTSLVAATGRTSLGLGSMALLNSSAITAHLIPNSDVSIDLGSASKRWQDIFVKHLKVEETSSIGFSPVEVLMTGTNPVVAMYVSKSGTSSAVAIYGTGTFRGVEGVCGGGSTAAGVYGHAPTDGRGVYGLTDTGVGVWGKATNAAGYGGYFEGKTHVQGVFTATTKTFKIDHPLDPENKFLYHNSIESPEMRTVYYGRATTFNGVVSIDLPEWWTALNGADKTEYNYLLTPIGKWAKLFISKEIENNQFEVSSLDGDCTFSWTISAIRHDDFAESNRVQIEEEKTQEEKDRYSKE